MSEGGEKGRGRDRESMRVYQIKRVSVNNVLICLLQIQRVYIYVLLCLSVIVCALTVCLHA